jgi:hypothetical protein
LIGLFKAQSKSTKYKVGIASCDGFVKSKQKEQSTKYKVGIASGDEFTIN